MNEIDRILSYFPSKSHVARLCRVSSPAVTKWSYMGIPMRRAMMLAATKELKAAGVSLDDIITASLSVIDRREGGEP